MTNEEYLSAQAQLTAVETEAAALQQQVRDYIDKAREFNDARRATDLKRTALLKSAEPLRQLVAAHVAELKQQAVAKVKAEAEAKAAARAQEATELQKKDAEIASLKEQLAAKG